MKTIKECIINEYRGISGNVINNYKHIKNGDEFIGEMISILHGVNFFDAVAKAVETKVFNLKELSTDKFKEDLFNSILDTTCNYVEQNK